MNKLHEPGQLEQALLLWEMPRVNGASAKGKSVRLEEASGLHEIRALKLLYATSSQLWRSAIASEPSILEAASELLGAELVTLHLVSRSRGRNIS